MDEVRRKRVEEELKSEVGMLLLSGAVKDPRVDSFISITRVDVARDGSHAKLFVSTFKDENLLDEAVKGLNNAAGFIQSVIGKKLRIRLTPRLSFFADTGVKEGFELNEKIKGLFP